MQLKGRFVTSNVPIMMNLSAFSKLVGIMLLAACILSCERTNCEQEEPTLTFDTLQLNQTRDTLIYSVEFSDCQGDIGHIGKVDSTTTRTVRTFLYEKINNEWVRWFPLPENLSDTVAFFSVIPGSNKNRPGWLLEGTIIQDFGLANLRQNSDTIRFETYVLDNAENKSNRVVSTPFVFPSSN